MSASPPIDVNKLRQDYSTITSKVQNKEFDKKFVTLVKESKLNAQKQRQLMIATDNYEHLEEANACIQKYEEMQKLIKMKKQNQVTSTDFVSRSRILFNNQNNQSFGNNSNNNINISFGSNNNLGLASNKSFDREPVRDNSPHRAALNSFFDKKSSQIHPQQTLQSVLQNPPLNPQPFRKSSQASPELTALKKQNSQLKMRIQNISNDKQSITRLQSTYQNNKLQLQALQRQFSELTKDNLKLKSQKSVSLWNNSGEEEDFLYSPYIINIRQNDIYEINGRNMERSCKQSDIGSLQDEEEKQEQKNNQVVVKKVGYQYDTYTEKEYEADKNLTYSIFDINRSYLSENGDNTLEQTGIDINNSRILTRNKLCYFKNKGIIIRNSEIEIGYKKSQIQNQCIRIILYFNNRNAEYKKVRVTYQYKQDYYQLAVAQKIHQLDSFRQGREVLQVRRRGPREDLNQIVDAYITVDSKTYHILVPVMFLKLTGNKYATSTQKTSTKTVEPCLKAFSTPNEAAKVIEGLRVLGNNQAQCWVQSPLGNGPVGFEWGSKGSLRVTTSKKWLGILTLLMYGGD